LTFFVVQLAVAVFVKFLSHAFPHGLASGLALFLVEFAVAVFIVLFEHLLTTLLPAGPIAAIFRRLSYCRQGQEHGCRHCECC
jgi:hypothetical protein